MTICYDLIFPEYIRSLIDLGADIVINSTNWIHDPYQRDFWGWSPERTQGLVSTRALENVAFVAMSCRVGHEVAGPDLAFDSFGPSCVASPSGKILARIVDGEGVAVAHVDISGIRARSLARHRDVPDRPPAGTLSLTANRAAQRDRPITVRMPMDPGAAPFTRLIPAGFRRRCCCLRSRNGIRLLPTGG